MTEVALEADVDVDVDSNDTELRTRVFVKGATYYDVREKFPTVVRYLKKAEGSELATFSTGPRQRIAVNPAEVTHVIELSR